MSTYSITADSRKDIYSSLTYSAVLCNQTHITKIILPGAYYYYENKERQTFPEFTVEINGTKYSTSIPIDGVPEFDTDIFLNKGDVLKITVISVSVSSENMSKSVSVDIYSGSCPGWDCPNGFFALTYEGTRNTMWIEIADDYPALDGVTASYRYYDNYGLPFPHKYKVRDDINDGYPYIYKIKSGWTVSYAYEKNGGWLGARIWVRSGGEWKESTAVIYDALSALYQRPDIKTGWRITSGANGGYPHIVYSEIPFYEEE